MTATFTKTLRKTILALTIATTLGAMTSTQSFAYSAEAQSAVHRRRLPPVQQRNPEHSEDHRLHVQAPLRAFRGLPLRDGPRPRGAEVGQVCR